MTPLEILLILIGAGIIIFSCFLVDKSTEKIVSEVTKREITTEEIVEIKNKIDTIIAEVSEEIVLKTEDQLNKISNEKIIAVNEFSNQIIEKISQNHEEVVFLYTMLNDKESELKEALKQVDLTKKQLSEIEFINPRSVKTKENTGSPNKAGNTGSTDNKVSAGNTKKNPSSSVSREFDQTNSPVNRPLVEMDVNYNDKILDLHTQGKSIIEISKILGLGQGEVKLVIDLFK